MVKYRQERESMLVLYGSKYGTARRYAEEFARRAGTAAVSVKGRVPAAEGITVFFGALYMGRVYGLKRAVKKAAGCSRLLVVTVGLADPSEPAVAESRSTGKITRTRKRSFPFNAGARSHCRAHKKPLR